MDKNRQLRTDKLKFAFASIPWWILGIMAHVGVRVADGNIWDAFMVNRLAYSLYFFATSIVVFSIVNWLRTGLKQRRDE